MIDGLSDWLRSVKESLGNVYDEARKVGSNFVEWCVDAPVVVSVLVGSTALLFGWLYLVSYSSNPRPWVRGTGVALQLVGFILAAYGLERTLEKFGQRPSTSRILPWLRDFWEVFETDRVVSVSATGTISPSVTAKATVEQPEPEDPTLEERVEQLEEQLNSVRDDLTEVRRHVDGEVERLESKIEEEVEAVEEDVEEMREKVKEVNVGEGALWLEWCGVSFFVYGVPLASFPSFFLPAYRILAVPVVAGTLLYSLHWYAD